MELEKETKIEYQILNTKTQEISYITLSVEQIEGSVPSLYEHLEQVLEIPSGKMKILKRIVK